MMGKSIYFTDKELLRVRDSIMYYMDLMSDGEEKYDIVAEELENGLGSALHKLYKGCNGEGIYAKYSRKRNKSTAPQQCGRCEGKEE